MVRQLHKYLIERLTARGFAIEHVPGVVRNVLHLIGDGGVFTTEMVNQQLELLGWGADALDETSFQLIVCILESQFDYKVSHYSINQEKKGAEEGPKTYMM
ncbi:MAG: hypothetical protein P8075_04950 [Deltaproteobacteria bacterium]|jgi:hypothetical protein